MLITRNILLPIAVLVIALLSIAAMPTPPAQSAKQAPVYKLRLSPAEGKAVSLQAVAALLCACTATATHGH